MKARCSDCDRRARSICARCLDTFCVVHADTHLCPKRHFCRALALVLALALSACAQTREQPTQCELACVRMREIGCAHLEADHGAAFEEACFTNCPMLLQKKIFTPKILQCIIDFPDTATCVNVSDCAPGL